MGGLKSCRGEDFPSMLPSFRPSIVWSGHPSVHPSCLRSSGLGLKPGWLGLRLAWAKVWMAGPDAWLARPEACLTMHQASRMDGWKIYSILLDLVAYLAAAQKYTP